MEITDYLLTLILIALVVLIFKKKKKIVKEIFVTKEEKTFVGDKEMLILYHLINLLGYEVDKNYSERPAQEWYCLSDVLIKKKKISK